ncbi:MAG: rRNA adenine N-6-methyltransferase family protein [Candidatus Caldarchaeum sp.]|nr:rRNA adenine N-6-methyltransferase family protein [Candidatus Caldarchaeum sp.]
MARDQHFLTDESVVRKIVDRAEVSASDIVLDIGAGVGALTVEAAKAAKLVYAVENDATLVPLLRNATAELRNVRIIVADILKTRLPPYTKIISNPPFSLLEPILMRHLRKPVPMSLLTPKKFAENIVTTKTAIGLKASLAYKPEVVEFFDGNICQPPYPGKLAHILLRPTEKTPLQEAMIDFLRQSTSKTRNALRNVLWTYGTKRTATKAVELSPLSDRLLETRVKRTSYEDLQAILLFLKQALSDKNLRIEQSSN